MKPTQEQVIAWARDSGMELYGLGKDRAKFVYYLETFATLAYEAGRKDEREWREHKDLHISFGELLEKAAAQGDKLKGKNSA